MQIPQKAENDALQIATVHRIELLATWNCKRERAFTQARRELDSKAGT